MHSPWSHFRSWLGLRFSYTSIIYMCIRCVCKPGLQLWTELSLVRDWVEDKIYSGKHRYIPTYLYDVCGMVFRFSVMVLPLSMLLVIWYAKYCNTRADVCSPIQAYVCVHTYMHKHMYTYGASLTKPSPGTHIYTDGEYVTHIYTCILCYMYRYMRVSRNSFVMRPQRWNQCVNIIHTSKLWIHAQFDVITHKLLFEVVLSIVTFMKKTII